MHAEQQKSRSDSFSEDSGCRHRNGMRQAKCVHRNMALDARDFLARVIALKARSVRVFDALRINNHERARFAAPLPASGHANPIF